MEVMTLQHRGRLVAAGVAFAILQMAYGSAAPAQPATSPARMVTGRHVTVEIITDTDRVRAGATSLGLRFTMEPGWHIYHLQPGDGGDPPDATWHLPAGMKASPFQWPAPERIESNGLVNYGYHGVVTLPVRLDVAADFPASPVVVRADVRWLVCNDMCVSGSGTVELRWPLGNADRAQLPAWSAAIHDARARVPKTAAGR
jgi:DsbC/DsbD-like thiol-disulfide interchange protein